MFDCEINYKKIENKIMKIKLKKTEGYLAKIKDPPKFIQLLPIQKKKLLES